MFIQIYQIIYIYILVYQSKKYQYQIPKVTNLVNS